jgi:hypothetical protein
MRKVAEVGVDHLSQVVGMEVHLEFELLGVALTDNKLKSRLTSWYLVIILEWSLASVLDFILSKSSLILLSSFSFKPKFSGA